MSTSCSTQASFAMFAGDDIRFRISVQDQDTNPVDVSTATDIRFALANQAASTPLFTKSLSNGIFVDSANVFMVDLVPADTEGLNGKYYFEADITNLSGNTYTVLTGYITVKPVSLVGV